MFIGTILRASPGQHLADFFENVIRYRHDMSFPGRALMTLPQENAIIVADFNGTFVDVRYSDSILDLYRKWIDARFLGVQK